MWPGLIDASIGRGLVEASRSAQGHGGFTLERLVSDDVETARDAIQQIVQRYLYLYAQQSWDDWIDLWADDGVLEFPFAPAGRRSHYVGKADILAYMKAVPARMAGRIRSEGLDYFDIRPMLDPAMVCLEMGVKGRILETGAPYLQKYVSIIETRGGKLSLYREYWNPLVSMDANGGREAWTAAFGSPEEHEPGPKEVAS